MTLLTQQDHSEIGLQDPIRSAERSGLRLAILCRTIAVGLAFLWLTSVAFYGLLGFDDWIPPVSRLFTLAAFFAFGLLTLYLVSKDRNRWWVKYALYTADVIGVCALFVLLPMGGQIEVPQILTFWAHGIHYLFPLIAMSALSLSWRLVAWTSTMVVIGWWSAFAWVALQVADPSSWSDIVLEEGLEGYLDVLLSPNFVGYGTRVEETGLTYIAGLTLALAVYRARAVFKRWVLANQDREHELATRVRITRLFGHFVPQPVVQHLVYDDAELQPREEYCVVLVADIAGFTRFANAHNTADVMERLNTFLSQVSQVVDDTGGTVITFTGDGLIATFGAPSAVDIPEARALAAAEQFISIAGKNQFSVRVGLAAGPVSLGLVGSPARRTFTIYGAAVNRAARLENLGKRLKRPIMMDAAIAKVVNDRARDADYAGPIEGFAHDVEVWTLPPRNDMNATNASRSRTTTKRSPVLLNVAPV